MLKVNRSGSCNSCYASNSCGTRILSNYFEHYSTFTKPKNLGVSVGEFITLEVTEKELFLCAFQLYLLPLIALFLVDMLPINFTQMMKYYKYL